MTTNQTIDGVPRVLLEQALCGDFKECLQAQRGLRALLAKPAARPEPSCIQDLERFESDGEDYVKVADVLDMLGNLKAAEHQGEPVVWWNGCNESVPAALRYLANHPRPSGGEQRYNSEHLYQLAGEIERMAKTPLYARPAEQSAPVSVAHSCGLDKPSVCRVCKPSTVAVVMPERPYASEEEQQVMTEYEIGLGHGACEMWDKIKFLNPRAKP